MPPLVLEATGGSRCQSEVLVWFGAPLVRDPFTEVSILFTINLFQPKDFLICNSTSIYKTLCWLTCNQRRAVPLKLLISKKNELHSQPGFLIIPSCATHKHFFSSYYRPNTALTHWNCGRSLGEGRDRKSVV